MRMLTAVRINEVRIPDSSLTYALLRINYCLGLRSGWILGMYLTKRKKCFRLRQQETAKTRCTFPCLVLSMAIVIAEGRRTKIIAQ